MIKWLNNLFSKTDDNIEYLKQEVHEHQKNNIKKVSTKFLIVGLGNIGAEYVNTRHNIGFKIVDFLARKEGINFETVKLGALAQYKLKGRTFLLLKPNTFMNLSGKAVHYWMEKENIPLENLMIIMKIFVSFSFFDFQVSYPAQIHYKPLLFANSLLNSVIS